jgi:uncharacterized protein (TIGR00297 family)
MAVSSAMLMRLVAGFAGAAVVALTARRLKMLTTDGAVAAAIIGAIVFGLGGWFMTALLLLFFLSSSGLTRLEAARKSHPEHRRDRSAGQVLANGAVPAAIAIWYGINPSAIALSAFAGAIAASTADTWATEIGLLSPATPRLITTWEKVPRGSSGAVTLLGTIGGIVGASAIAVVAFYWMRTPVVSVFAAGVLAMCADSVLGATLEGRVKWIDNDVVNLTATAIGAALGYASA